MALNTMPPQAPVHSPVSAMPPAAATLPPPTATLPPTTATLPPTTATLPADDDLGPAYTDAYAPSHAGVDDLGVSGATGDRDDSDGVELDSRDLDSRGLGSRVDSRDLDSRVDSRLVDDEPESEPVPSTSLRSGPGFPSTSDVPEPRTADDDDEPERPSPVARQDRTSRLAARISSRR